jgi:DNA polymerase
MKSLPSTIVSLDFETFYDDEYTLKKLTTEAYVRDPRFEVVGVAVKVDDGPAEWMPAERLRGLLDWQNVATLAHHAQFDGFILSHHFDVRPAFWFDTLSMGRALHGVGAGNSLGALLPWYGLGEKGDEVVRAKGKRRADFTPEELAAYGAYCVNDTEGAYRLLCAMLAAGFPESELRLIDMTVKMFTEPRIVVDREKLADYITDERARKSALLDRLGTTATELGSNEKLAEIFRALGVEPPMKDGKNGRIYAFAKSDPGMSALIDDLNDDVRRVAEARLEVKSTINETRATRLHAVGGRGALPVYLK